MQIVQTPRHNQHYTRVLAFGHCQRKFNSFSDNTYHCHEKSLLVCRYSDDVHYPKRYQQIHHMSQRGSWMLVCVPSI